MRHNISPVNLVEGLVCNVKFIHNFHMVWSTFKNVVKHAGKKVIVSLEAKCHISTVFVFLSNNGHNYLQFPKFEFPSKDLHFLANGFPKCTLFHSWLKNLLLVYVRVIPYDMKKKKKTMAPAQAGTFPQNCCFYMVWPHYHILAR